MVSVLYLQLVYSNSIPQLPRGLSLATVEYRVNPSNTFDWCNPSGLCCDWSVSLSQPPQCTSENCRDSCAPTQRFCTVYACAAITPQLPLIIRPLAPICCCLRPRNGQHEWQSRSERPQAQRMTLRTALSTQITSTVLSHVSRTHY